MVRLSLIFIMTLLATTSMGLAQSAEDNAGRQPTLDELLEIDPSVADTAAAEDAAEAAADVLDPEESMRMFQGVVTDMEQASARLSESKDPGLKTQRIQEDIMKKLDQVIASAKKQQGGGGSSSSDAQQQQQQNQGSSQNQQQSQQANASQSSNPNPGTPTRGSVTGVTPDEGVDAMKDRWGDLPPRLRDELIQGLNEWVSPVYREMTEAYYRRLAEQEEQ